MNFGSLLFAVGIIRDCNPLEIVRHPWFVSAFAAAACSQLMKLLAGVWDFWK